MTRFVAPGPLVAMHTPVLPLARVAVRRMTGVLLVGGQYMPNPILPLVQLIVNRQNRAAGEAEHGSNAPAQSNIQSESPLR